MADLGGKPLDRLRPPFGDSVDLPRKKGGREWADRNPLNTLENFMLFLFYVSLTPLAPNLFARSELLLSKDIDANKLGGEGRGEGEIL